MNTKNGRYRLIIVVLVCLGIFAPNYAQFQLSSLGQRFMDSIGIAPENAGTVLSSIMTGSLIPGVLLSLVSGVLVDKFGAKKVLVAGFFLTALGSFLRIWAASYPFMLICMILIGVNATVLNSNASKIFGIWLSPTVAGIIMGVFLGVANAAMALGIGTGALYPTLSIAFTVSAIVSVTAFLLWTVFAKDNKNKALNDALPERVPVVECLKTAVRSKGVWITSLSLMALCTAGISVNMFLPIALSNARGFTEQTAGAFSMANTIGAMLSCFITPFINTKLGKPKLQMLVYGSLATIGLAFSWRVPEGFPLVAALFMTGFLSTGLSPILMSIPIRLPEIGPRYAGTAGGFVATIQLLGCVLIPTYIITPISGSNYNLLFYCFAAIMLFFCMTVFLLPNSKKLQN